MNIVWILLHTLITNGLEIVIFFKVDGINLTFERIFKAFLLKILLVFVFVMISYIVGNVYLSYFMEPLYGIGLSFLLLRGLPKKLLFFYGLGTLTVVK
ncbi:BlpH histidine kinase TCS13 [Streptococcus pneumoniae]|nr:BlpH histidine kinase TCS13 [Streptococcus pneumoniae]